MHISTVATAETSLAVQELAASIIEHAPATHLTVMDVDGTVPPSLPGRTDVRRVAELDHDGADVLRAAALLEPADFLAWLQPVVLLDALRTRSSTVWVSPTSLIFADLSDLAALAETHGTILVPGDGRPRSPSPTSAGDRRTEDLPGSEVFSADLLAVGRRALDDLGWWAESVIRRGAGRWLDHLAASPAHTVVHDPGLDVGERTIGSRLISGTPREPTIDGAPVRHLSLEGFDPAQPWLLDARADRPATLLSTQPVLAELCRIYAQRLTARAPASVEAHDSVTRGLRSRHTLSAPRRTAYVHALDDPDHPPPNPLAEPGGEKLTAWLREPVPGTSPPLSRYLHAVWLGRADLRAAFPDVPHRNIEALVTWAATHGRDEPTCETDLIEHSVALARAHIESASTPGPDSSPPPAGVNVVGYLRGELGVGESARLMLSALEAAAIPHRTVPVSRLVQSRQQAVFAASEGQATPFDVTLLCVNADMTPTTAAIVPDLLADRYRIGMWYWEVEDFPAAMDPAFAHVDEVWAATDFVRDAIAARTELPVVTMTPPLRQPAPAPGLTRADLGLPEGFLVLFSFDLLSTMERKNPTGLVDAFRRAFPRGSGPTLVLKTINADKRVHDAERLRLLVADEPDIVLVEDYLDAAERDALVDLCDCYVSLHRSEGLGLTMAEAMALGKPVVATGYSGNLQFMSEENSFLVPWTPTTIPAGCAPYPEGSTWAEPDLDAAAAILRTIHEDPDLAAARGRRAAHDLAELHSPAAAGARITARLEQIRPAPVEAPPTWRRAIGRARAALPSRGT